MLSDKLETMIAALYAELPRVTPSVSLFLRDALGGLLAAIDVVTLSGAI